MNIYLKRLVLVLSLFTFLSFSYNQVRANADVGLLTIGAEAVGVDVAAPLVLGIGVLYLGYKVYDAYGDDVKSFINKEVLSLRSSAVNAYFKHYKSSDGSDYIGLTDDGVNWAQSEITSYSSKTAIPHDVSGSVTNPFESSSSPKDFEYDGYLMHPYALLANGSIYNTFMISSGDTLSGYAGNSGSSAASIQTKFTHTNMSTSNEYIRFRQLTQQIYCVEYSSDGSSWSSISNLYSNPGYYNTIGYSTTSNTVYVPGSQVFINTGSTGSLSSTETMAIPISGQYDSTKGETVYNAIDGATATAVSGLTAKDGSTTGEGTGAGTGTDTQTGFWDSLWDWLKNIIDGIRAIPKLILDWFTIDWDRVKTHINYIDIVKQHFQPIYDIFDLISNVSADIKDSDGKFYMVIPHEMGGDDQEHCVLDLSVGAVYITTARDVIKYGMWMGFVWYVFRKFDPKFSI